MDSFKNIINILDQLGTHTSLNQKLQTLKRNCETLCSREADVYDEIQFAESNSRKKRRLEVEDWFINVQSIKNKVESIHQDVRGSGLLNRLQLVNRVENLCTQVARLIEHGKFPNGLTLSAHDHRGKALLTAQLVGRAFEINLASVWRYLLKPEVLIIGIWGMGGVGKTTLVKHIHNRVLGQLNMSFDHVYWVTVSQNYSIHKLQDDIAEAIGFKIPSYKEDMKRAADLSAELTKRQRSVLILDDVWNDFSLEDVGISIAVHGCKLIITTRSLVVCRRLGCHEYVKVEPLSEEEAWDLFVKNLRHQRDGALSVEVLEVAKRVARECAGLPLGIITMARCMREVNDVREWRDALQTLIESKVGMIEMEEEVFHVLRFSYNRLNDQKVQQCFLYCALYPEDHCIRREELIERLIDDGLVELTRARQAQFDAGHAILNKLENSCLLEAVNCSTVDSDAHIEGVKMHDLVRDMAIKITTPEFMVKAGMQLCQIPNERNWSEDVEKVSLMKNYITDIALSTSPRCPKLLTLLLSGNTFLKRIKNSFFAHMLALQVLDLSDTWIEELPNSVSNLRNLSALVLRGCRNLQEMPSVAKLKCLKRLDLYGCGIRKVPHGFNRLINLTYLDLDKTKLEVFPSGILPKLSQLEYLKFECSSITTLKVEGDELRKLERLSTFQGQLNIDNAKDFKAYVTSRQRYQGPNCSYYFVLDDGRKRVNKVWNREDNLSYVRIVNWSIRKGTTQEEEEEEDVDGDVEALEALLKDVQSLQIESCNDARSLRDISWLDNATHDLKQCEIYNCNGIQHLGSFSSPSFLRTLEILKLKNLDNIDILFELEGQGDGTIFSRLKELSLQDCPKIKKLFEPGFLKHLVRIENIRVENCDQLVEIIAEEDPSSSSSNNHCFMVEYALPNLKTLKLIRLPKLKSICAETISCGCLCNIEVAGCGKLTRIPLHPPSSLQSIKVDSAYWWERVVWDLPNAKDILKPIYKL